MDSPQYADLLELAKQMPIPTPWDRDEFVANIAQMRGRPITLVPANTTVLADSPCGLWLARESDDIIVHEIGTSEYHISQIVCHEIGHMVLGHGLNTSGEKYSFADLCATFMPDLDLETVNSVLTRREYSAEQEHDAELFASLLTTTAAEKTHARSMVRSVFFQRR